MITSILLYGSNKLESIFLGHENGKNAKIRAIPLMMSNSLRSAPRKLSTIMQITYTVSIKAKRA